MTDPVEGRQGELPVRLTDVVLGHHHPEEEEGGLAVGGSQDRGGAEQRSSTERLRGQLGSEGNLARHQ